MVIGGHGQYATALWNATLDTWPLDAPDGPHLKLVAPATITIGNQRLALSTACLAASDERFCAEGQANPRGEWNAKGTATRLPLKPLGRGLPGPPEVHGFLEMQLKAARQ